MAVTDDVIASVSACSVIPEQLKSGRWRGYLYSERTPSNPVAFAWDREVVRDEWGDIITEPTQEALIDRLRLTYPGWHWN